MTEATDDFIDQVPEDADPQLAASQGRTHGVAWILLLATAIIIAAAYFDDQHGNSLLKAAGPIDCVGFADNEARLACYDETMHRVPLQPARGALAPQPNL